MIKFMYFTNIFHFNNKHNFRLEIPKKRKWKYWQTVLVVPILIMMKDTHKMYCCVLINLPFPFFFWGIIIYNETLLRVSFKVPLILTNPTVYSPHLYQDRIFLSPQEVLSYFSTNPHPLPTKTATNNFISMPGYFCIL